MEENKTFSKSSLLNYRISSSILIILVYVLIMGCLYYCGVNFNIPVYIGAFTGSLIGTFIRKPVRRYSRSRRMLTLFLTIPFTILICVIVFISGTENVIIKIIFSIVIVLSVMGCEIIENKLLNKLWNENTN